MEKIDDDQYDRGEGRYGPDMSAMRQGRRPGPEKKREEPKMFNPHEASTWGEHEFPVGYEQEEEKPARAKPFGPRTVLRRGQSGSDIKEMQTKLRNAGFDIKVDGIFGPKTEAAMMKFQKDMGLDSDGVYGKATRSKMDMAHEDDDDILDDMDIEDEENESQAAEESWVPDVEEYRGRGPVKKKKRVSYSDTGVGKL